MNVNVKNKIVGFVDKVTNSKAYKAVEKAAVTVGAGLFTAGTMAMTSFAVDEVGSTTALTAINSKEVLNNAMPFINAGIPILAVVGGIRLGVRFLRGSMH